MNFTWDPWLPRILCNHNDSTPLSILHHGSSKWVYYLDDCFQSTFVVLPFYALLAFWSSFYVGRHRIVWSRVFTSNNRWETISGIQFTRFISLWLLTFVQIALFLSDPTKSPIWAILNAFKLTAFALTFLAVVNSVFIREFEVAFKFFKSFLVVLHLVSASELVTICCDSSSSWPIVALYGSATFSWTISIISIVILKDNKHQINHALLNSESSLEQVEEQVSLKCDESKSYLAQIFFTWVVPLLDRGKQCQINSFQDLFQLPSSLNTQHWSGFVDDYLNKYKNDQTSARSFLTIVFKKFGLRIFMLGSLKLISDGLSFVAVIYLNKLLLFLDTSGNSLYGYRLAFSLFLVTLFNALISSLFNFQMSKLSLK